MPVSPAIAEQLAQVIGVLYAEAELALIERIQRWLAADIEAPYWLSAKLASVRDVQAAVQAILDALATDADGKIRQALAEAYGRGQQAAVAELGALATGQAAAAAVAIPGAPVVDRLAREVIDGMGPVYSRILRTPTDVYRAVVATATPRTLLGVETRRETSQRVLDGLASRGVTGFVDTSGRAWDMASYAEMAVRSATGRAAIEAHTDRLGAAGVDLIIVSEQPLHCKKCDPWAGKILTRTSGQGGARTVEVEHATRDGETVTVEVAGSLPQARAAGLLHPNCRCSISAYLPGVTRPMSTPPHPQGATYEDTQRQREMERHVRRWKRRAAAAMTDDERRRANARVREWQAAIRALTDEKGLRRKPQREQIKSAR
ncbi:phage minor capsid protein [Yinghuangia soli]|uniref:Phage minor capsid protein n=1 Tax=Yinghuangia soli TaxID=2908204 RepID=A0AA41Q561_9ACTN|nr:phage minor capsid protein [Yinghuangia soli]MCF2531743.1 phage minor capsid protein [Yinghuangia soli]